MIARYRWLPGTDRLLTHLISCSSALANSIRLPFLFILKRKIRKFYYGSFYYNRVKGEFFFGISLKDESLTFGFKDFSEISNMFRGKVEFVKEK